MKKIRTQRGVTMMEMVITLLILGMVAALGLPSLNGFIEGNRLNAAIADLQSSMQTARSEAVGRNAYVTLCPINSSGNNCGAWVNRGWHHGWYIFVDVDGDARIDGGDGDEIIYIHDALLGSLTLHGTAGVRNFITFRPSGMTSVTSTQTFILCDGRGFVDEAKGLVVSIMGRGSTMSATSTNQTSCLLTV